MHYNQPTGSWVMERSSSMVSWCTVSSLLYWAWKSTLSGRILWRWKNNRQLFIFVLDFGRKLWSVNSQPNPEVRKTNWTKRVVYYILSGTHQVVVIHFWSNHRGQVFWENHFFLFCEAFGGVILLKLFNPSYGFGVIDGQIAIFWDN